MTLATRHELGSAYREVLALSGGALGIARKDHLLSLFSGEDDVVHLDLEGRLHRAWLGGRSFQRGLDGRVRRVSVSGAERSLQVEVLPAGDSARVLERVAEVVARVARELPSGTDPALADPLERAIEQARPGAVAVEAERFRSAYEPVPILPPDQHRALVVQLTSGCSWNRCTFCHLYRDASFAMKSPEALGEHVQKVLDLVGRALPLRRGIFLGQANALVLAQDKLVPLLRVLARELERAGAPQGLGRLAAFVDAFTRPKSVDEWRELRDLGLRGVSLGLESGSAEVLRTLGKPAEIDDAVALAGSLRDAGVKLGVIVLAGAGGRRLALRHVEDTVETLQRMELGAGDRIYLSPLSVEPESTFAKSLTQLDALSRGEISAEAEELRARLRSAGVRVPIALYDVRRFVY